MRIFLPLAIATMMLSLGLGLTVADFTRLLRHPKAFVCGFTGQLLLAPLATFALITIFGLSGKIAVGFMLLSACPGGGVSNIITKFGQGDVALSVSLTSVSSLLSMLTIPLVLNWSIGYFMGDIAFVFQQSAIVMTTFIICAGPILLGMFIRGISAEKAENWGAILTKVSAGFLLIIIIAAVTVSWPLFIENLWFLGGMLTALGLTLATIGYILPAALGLGSRCARTISIEVGIQNGALGISIAALLSNGASEIGDYALASALYGVMMYFFIIPLAYIFRITAVRESGVSD
ncbi:bile acid:sodium symporter family protein [Celeribacter baekdonensis]|uniref:bile acid:sodium symporter family protein n=1 Tax=Celeribacter baekdonensis TaxID=875171 RepID=UPI003A8FDBEF